MVTPWSVLDGAAHEPRGETDLRGSRAAVAARDEGRSLAREQELKRNLLHVSCSPPWGSIVGERRKIAPPAAHRSAGNSPVSRSASPCVSIWWWGVPGSPGASCHARSRRSLRISRTYTRYTLAASPTSSRPPMTAAQPGLRRPLCRSEEHTSELQH